MPDVLFDSSTPRYSLPLLFAGQTQKEGFVNEITARLDALLFPVIEGQAAAPPTGAQDGQSWLVSNSPADEWFGHAGRIASRQSGNWLFTEPVYGMRLFNKSVGQDMYFRDTWITAQKPATPQGGTTIDSESRAAISTIIAALISAGIVPEG